MEDGVLGEGLDRRRRHRLLPPLHQRLPVLDWRNPHSSPSCLRCEAQALTGMREEEAAPGYAPAPAHEEERHLHTPSFPPPPSQEGR